MPLYGFDRGLIGTEYVKYKVVELGPKPILLNAATLKYTVSLISII